MISATIDGSKLSNWLDAALPGPPAPLTILQEPTHGIFRIERAGASYALRVQGTAEADFGRALTLLKGLARSPIQHPRLVAVCMNETAIGTAFILTQWIDGFAPGTTLPEAYCNEAAAHSLAEELIDGLVAITIANWPAMGLSSFGDQDNFLHDQVMHWIARSGGMPGLDPLRAWLSANIPPAQRKALVHGAYGFHNTIFAQSHPPRVAAIVGWNAATIGDPMLDLGDVLAYWPNPDDNLPAISDVNWSLFPTRSELVKRYAQRTALGISNLKFYLAFALFKKAVAAHGGSDMAAIVERAHHFAGIADRQAGS